MAVAFDAVPSAPQPNAVRASDATFDRKAAAVRRALASFGIMPGMVVAVVVALLVGPLLGLLAVVLVAAVWASLVWLRARSSLTRLIDVVGAVPAAAGTGDARWANVIDGLCATSGLDGVELLVVDRPEANALAASSSDRDVVVVTRGLVEALSLVELEGVGANLLGRIRDGSARYGTEVFGLLGPFLGSLAAADRLVADGLGDQRDVHSDLAAVEVTRYPPGLASALAHMDRIGTAVPGAAPATAHLWIAPIVAEAAGVGAAVAATTMQPVSYRVAVLEEL